MDLAWSYEVDVFAYRILFIILVISQIEIRPSAQIY